MEALGNMTKLIPILNTGTQLASGASNIYQGYKNQAYQDQLRELSQNPEKFNAFASQFIKPLNAGLEKGVGNEAQAYAAERGLAQSPGPQADIISQAIAPYIQQNNQNGYNIALKTLGIGGGAQPPVDTQSGLTQLFAGMQGLTPYANLIRAQHAASPNTPGNQMQLINSDLSTLIPNEGQGMQDFFSNSGGFLPPSGGFSSSTGTPVSFPGMNFDEGGF